MLSRSLGGLQGDVAGEAVGDDNVYDVVTDIVTLDLGLAPRFLHLENDVSDDWGFAIEVFGDVGVHPVPTFHLHAGAAWAPFLAGPDDVPSVYGVPRSVTDMYGGVSFDFGGPSQTWSIVLQWQGQLMQMGYTERFYHGPSAGIRFTL